MPANFTYTLTDDILDLEFKPVSRTVLSFREECIETARYIKSQTNNPIMIALSGGIDSELVCRAFKDAGIAFTAVTFVYITNGVVCNPHDVKYAVEFCKEFNISQKLISLDFKNFIETGITKYIDQGYRSSSFADYIQLYYLEHVTELGGCMVAGELTPTFVRKNNELNLVYGSRFTIREEWCRKNNQIHFPFFFATTPEVMAVYINHPLMQFLSSDEIYFIGEHAYVDYEKPIIFHAAYPEMTKRVKLTGFERYSLEIKNSNNTLKNKFPNIGGFYIPLEKVKAQLNIP